MDEIEQRLRRVVAADDRATLWAELEPLRAHLGDDPRVARLWAEALRTSIERDDLLDDARTIAEAWPGEPSIVAPLCDALIRSCERSPIDEPPRYADAGILAAEAAGRCLSRLDASAKRDPEIAGALHALRGNALRTLGPGRRDDAVKALEAALALEERGGWRFELGLVHKQARDWSAALGANRRAREQLPDDRGVLFNLAIAATAVGEGAAAGEAWRAASIPAETKEGSLPFVEGLPPAQVRLPTLGSGHTDAVVPDHAAGFETVWVQPLSPCHGVVRTPTHREAVADFGDVVLWDPAPVQVVERDGAPVPRFPLLEVLRRGDERRLRFLALQQREGQVEAIGERLGEGVVLYPHGERVEVVCPRCAAGDLLVKHDHLPAEEHRVVHGKIIVPGDVDLSELAQTLELARKGEPGVLMAIPALYEALGDTPQAGKHHKRWGMIERTARA